MLKVELFTDQSCFTTLGDEWLELLERSITNTPFQTPQFLQAWWQTLGEGELQVLTFRSDDKKLVGIAPLFNVKQDNHQKLCMVGCVNVSDYLDIIVDRDYSRQVYDKLEQQLKSHLFWDEIYLCSLPDGSPTIDWFKSIFPEVKQAKQDVCPAIKLPQTWDEYLESLKRKQRHEIRRKWRRLDEREYEFELITEAEAAAAAIDEFIKLHKLSSAEKQDFWDDNHLQFFKKLLPAMAEQGWLKLYYLAVDGQRAAAMLAFDYNNKYLLYNSGFDPQNFRELSTGNLLTAYTIKDAIENGRDVYDFLRGDEEYKFRFGAEPTPVWDLSYIAQ